MKAAALRNFKPDEMGDALPPEASSLPQKTPVKIIAMPVEVLSVKVPRVSAVWQNLSGWFKLNIGSAVLGVISIAMLIVLWYLAVRYRFDFYIRFTNIPAPYDVFNEAIKLSGSDSFFNNMLISLRRILIGFGIAVILGGALGLVIGRYQLARQLMYPVLEILRPIPAIAWVPIAIMLWPTNEGSIVFITFIGSFFPILLNTVHGVKSVDPVLIRAARCLGSGEPALLLQVILPAALPHIFTGLSVGMGVAWVSLIAAEMISGQYGIGYFTWEAYSLIQYADIVIGMIVIGVLGLACSGTIRAVGRMLMPWANQTGGSKP